VDLIIDAIKILAKKIMIAIQVLLVLRINAKAKIVAQQILNVIKALTVWMNCVDIIPNLLFALVMKIVEVMKNVLLVLIV
jgi:hypothetical protein